MRTLITGGSGGIGLALARICARHGHDLVLVSRSADLLAAAQAELRDTAHADVDVLACDLSLPGAGERECSTGQPMTPASRVVPRIGGSPGMV